MAGEISIPSEGQPSPPKPIASDDPRYKDACQYAVDVSEKFLTLSAGGIAFIIGLVFGKEDSLVVQLSSGVIRLALVAFGISILLGWLFLMNVVGSLAKENDYRIYNNAKQWLCSLQIIMALFGIGLLGYCTFHAIGKRSQNKSHHCIVRTN